MAKDEIGKNKLSRPPVVVVLGHVDHGKTSLLDKIRSSRLTAKEHGGITQAIGAYQISIASKEEKSPQRITFIDTPGHAAFAKMRSRGAQVADLAVLVVAADEGVKPQTVESLEFIKRAKIPFLVAINKTDLPNADLNYTKQSLVEAGVNIEDSGGDIVCTPVSAKTGEGIDTLLEMILLVSQMAGLGEDLKAELKAVVIESRLDPHKGPVATILVRQGSLKTGSLITAGGAEAKIKAMTNDKGEKTTVAGPSQPVEVMGFKSVPPVGAIVAKINDFKQETKDKQPRLDLKRQDKKKLGLIVKADTKGSLEAILAGLSKEAEVIYAEVGEINESDVLLAETLEAEIIGFNIKLSSKVKKLAQTQKVRVSVYNIIYQLFEEVEKRAQKYLAGELEEEILGRAKVLQEFSIKGEKIAGCVVLEGEISRDAKLHLVRGDRRIADLSLKSLKQGKQDILKASTGEDFGAVLSSRIDFKAGDVLVSYRKTDNE